MNAGCFVCWELDAPAEDVHDIVSEAASDATGTGVTAVLPDAGVQTVSVFIQGPAADRLAWFVEHDDRPIWRDPAEAIRTTSPLFETGLEATLADPADPLVVADTDPAVSELVHATLPDRPRGFADQTGHTPIVLSANDPAMAIPDVVPLRLDIRPGVGALFARCFRGAIELTPEWLEAKFEAWTEPIMEAEGMYTETLLLEQTPDGLVLWWYMEAGDMGEVKEAYYESDRRIARISEHFLGLVLERPERVLEHPVLASEFDLLVHAVAPTRGQR